MLQSQFFLSKIDSLVLAANSREGRIDVRQYACHISLYWLLQTAIRVWILDESLDSIGWREAGARTDDEMSLVEESSPEEKHVQIVSRVPKSLCVL